MQDPRFEQVMWIAQNFNKQASGRYVLFVGSSFPAFPSGMSVEDIMVIQEKTMTAFFDAKDDKHPVAIIPKEAHWILIRKDYLIQMPLQEYVEFSQARAAATHQLIEKAKKEAKATYPTEHEEGTDNLGFIAMTPSGPVMIGASQPDATTSASHKEIDRPGHYI